MSLEVIDLPTLDPEDSVIPIGERDIVRGVRVALREIHPVPLDLVELRRVLLDDCLRWFDTVNSRQAIVNGWVRDPRLLQPPGPLWEKAELAAQWGMRNQAAVLLRYGNRKQKQHRPKFMAVAEKYRL